ncbi:Hypothetical protein FKW44_015015 [Caligus rogercresseyi]|uniref:Uncharacterized protein n=1 Tax=Caligus rogercresseyi TaxID=217165 RepID=A0A7T8GZS7_CALRO|nr:Hypothetical protein FKW44_015015 [Caligus rogercresseyi]
MAFARNSAFFSAASQRTLNVGGSGLFPWLNTLQDQDYEDRTDCVLIPLMVEQRMI